MQQLDPEEAGDGAPYSTWKLREVQQLGVRALIWFFFSERPCLLLLPAEMRGRNPYNELLIFAR